MNLREKFDKEQGWNGPGVAAGKDAEFAILGSCTIPRSEWRGEYVPFDEAVDLAKKHQPNLLHRSRTLKQFRQLVVDRIANTHEPVKCYIAAGSPLDLYHGVDAFFEHNGRRVTIDLTLREKDNAKADVVVVATMDKDGVVSVDAAEMEAAAHKTADILNLRDARRQAA